MLLYQFLAFAAFGVFLCALYQYGFFSKLQPSSLFILIFLIQYGPLLLVDVRHPHDDDLIAGLGIADFGPIIAQYTYTSLTLAYLCLAAGFLIGDFALKKMFPSISSADYTGNRTLSLQIKMSLERIYLFLLIVAGICTILFLSLEIVREKISFFSSILSGRASGTDYMYFRRYTLGTDPLYREIVRLRMTISMPIMASLAAYGAYLGRPKLEMIAVFIVFSAVTILDLTKQGTVVALLEFLFSIYIVYRNGVLPSPKIIFIPMIFISILFFTVLLVLYGLQYSGVQGMGLQKLIHVLFYRVIYMNGDVIGLYFVFFQHPLFAKGVTTSSVLATIFHKQIFDETQYIPQVYGGVSSFPTVYFAGMWVDFGWIGIMLSSIAVGGICALADHTTRILHSIPMRAAYTACMFFSLNYFAEVQFFTCLLSYGIGVVIIGFLLLDYFVLQLTTYSTPALRGAEV